MQYINPNEVILTAFTVTGILTIIWGMYGIIKTKRLRDWPAVDGIVTVCLPESEDNDFLPHIEYSYTVDNHDYISTLKYPRGLTPDEQFKTKCLEKYPKGVAVRVHYNPADPSHSTTLDFVTDNWFIVGAGVLMTVGGLVLIAIHSPL